MQCKYLCFSLVVAVVISSHKLMAASRHETKLFAEAYETEKQNPHEAIKLYQQILSREKFDAELKKAAHWRLLFLQHRLLYVPEFFNTMDSLGSSKEKDKVKEKLVNELVLQLNTSRETLVEFISAIRTSSLEMENISPILTEFLLRQDNPIFIRLTREYYARQGKIANLDQFEENSQQEQPLERAAQAIEKKDYESAVFFLERVNFETLTATEKSKYYYLSGKIFSSQEKCHPAVLSYRLAEQWAAQPELVGRYRALAGFELFRCKKYNQAWGLLRQRRIGYEDKNIHLLRLILWAEAEKSPQARQLLRKQQRELLDERGQKYSPRLVDHALQIIEAER